ncbi:MAG TPA: hypothetical protein VML54_05925 [Candidatus Limnocylindrales bacterium]|nr:hypothetical protein [Candidatus Limnocylindrales bacterium]
MDTPDLVRARALLASLLPLRVEIAATRLAMLAPHLALLERQAGGEQPTALERADHAWRVYYLELTAALEHALDAVSQKDRELLRRLEAEDWVVSQEMNESRAALDAFDEDLRRLREEMEGPPGEK